MTVMFKEEQKTNQDVNTPKKSIIPKKVTEENKEKKAAKTLNVMRDICQDSKTTIETLETKRDNLIKQKKLDPTSKNDRELNSLNLDILNEEVNRLFFDNYAIKNNECVHTSKNDKQIDELKKQISVLHKYEMEFIKKDIEKLDRILEVMKNRRDEIVMNYRPFMTIIYAGTLSALKKLNEKIIHIMCEKCDLQGRFYDISDQYTTGDNLTKEFDKNRITLDGESRRLHEEYWKIADKKNPTPEDTKKLMRLNEQRIENDLKKSTEFYRVARYGSMHRWDALKEEIEKRKFK